MGRAATVGRIPNRAFNWSVLKGCVKGKGGETCGGREGGGCVERSEGKGEEGRFHVRLQWFALMALHGWQMYLAATSNWF